MGEGGEREEERAEEPSRLGTRLCWKDVMSSKGISSGMPESSTEDESK